MKALLFNTFLLLGFLVSLAVTATATSITVNADGSGDYLNIQAGVDGVALGDTILLSDGIFTGPGNRDIEFSGKTLVVRSVSGDASSCILDCEGNSTSEHRGFLFNGEGSLAQISSITIRNGWASSGGAIRIEDGCSPVITDCIFVSNVADYSGNGYGGAIYSYGSPHILRCSFIENIAGNRGGGIYAGDGSGIDAEIVECVIVGNQAEDGAGLHVRGTARVTSCVVAENIAGWGDARGGGISCRYHDAPLEGNTVVNNTGDEGAGIFLYNSPSSIISATIVAFNVGRGIQGSPVEVVCSDLFSNEGGDWVDWLESLANEDGNISGDPVFCGDHNPEAKYSLSNLSPCSPLNNPDCGLIGALDVGCNTTSAESPGILPTSLELQQCFPNPFNPQTTIRFSLPQDGKVTLGVFDLHGCLVTMLVDEEKRAGNYSAVWTGVDQAGKRVAGGVYLYRLMTDSAIKTEKMVLLK